MDTRNFTYMFYGFLAAWLILIAYVVLLVKREGKIKKQLADLKNLMEERQQQPSRERKGA